MLGGKADEKARYGEDAETPVHTARKFDALGKEVEEDEAEEDAGGEGVDDRDVAESVDAELGDASALCENMDDENGSDERRSGDDYGSCD